MATKSSDRREFGKSKGLSRKGSDPADWERANATLIRQAIACAGARGGALRLGYTSDGGAYAIGIYGDGAPYTEYVRPGEDIDDVLRQIVELFQDLDPAIIDPKNQV